MPHAQDQRAFLEALFAHTQGFLEIRLVTRQGGVSQRFFRLPDGIEPALDFARRLDGHAHVFFGALPRSQARGVGDAVRVVPALFADIDAKDFAGGEEEVAARFHRLSEAGYPPSVLVRSGSGGRHAYWLLDPPLVLSDGGPRDREWAEAALWAVADALGVPPKANVVHDLARVLRLPGTANVKHDPPTRCEIELFAPDRRYSPAAFDRLCAEHPRPQRTLSRREWVAFSQDQPTQVANPEALLEGLDLSAPIRRLIREGAPKGHRSEADQKVIVALVRAGADPDRIWAIFASFPIGDKFREHPYRDRYLGYSISKARQWVRDHPAPPRTQARQQMRGRAASFAHDR